MMFSVEQTTFYLNVIDKIQKHIRTLKEDSIQVKLEHFENETTLNELKECLLHPNEDLTNRLRMLLSKRWERIHQSTMCYTQQPLNPVNQLCLELATCLSFFEKKENKRHAPGPYLFLMPSLVIEEDIYGNNIHDFCLHEFILSDDGKVYIPIALCLYQASISDEGMLRHLVSMDDNFPPLNKTEIERLQKHSVEVKQLYQTLLLYNKQRFFGDELVYQLNQLKNALRKGDVLNGLGDGTEFNAGVLANLGIVDFFNYWETLPQRRKSAIFAETPALKDVIQRLFRPIDTNYEQVVFCIATLAYKLEPVIDKYSQKPAVVSLQQVLKTKEKALKIFLKQPDRLHSQGYSSPPKKLLHLIFEMSMELQQNFFSTTPYDNALEYALTEAPDELIHFDLDEITKQSILSVQSTAERDAPIISAAKKGALLAIQLFISWGANIKTKDSKKNTALHWAVKNGDVHTVKYLLGQNDLINEPDENGNTPLHIAVIEGHDSIIDMLLNAKAAIFIENNEKYNAFDLVRRKKPQLIDLFLMNIALLPAHCQEKCFSHLPHSPYPNAIFYAAEHRIDLFDALIEKTLENISFSENDFNHVNSRGLTPFILAAQLGKTSSLNKLFEKVFDINHFDKEQNTALHWAAIKGHTHLIQFLLNKGALLDLQNSKGNTPLHLATIQGYRSIVTLLLKHNALIHICNNEGKNVFKLVQEYNYDFIKLIIEHTNEKIKKNLNTLIHLAKLYPYFIQFLLVKLGTFPLLEQKNYLKQIINYSNDNVLTLSAFQYPDLLTTLFIKFAESHGSNTAKDPLFKNGLFVNLTNLCYHFQSMKAKHDKNLHYETAISTMKILLQALLEALIHYFQSNEHINLKMVRLNDTFKASIKQALPVLKQHRGFFQSNFFSVTISNSSKFFSTKTKSVQLIEQIEKCLQRIIEKEKQCEHTYSNLLISP